MLDRLPCAGRRWYSPNPSRASSSLSGRKRDWYAATEESGHGDPRHGSGAGAGGCPGAAWRSRRPEEEGQEWAQTAHASRTGTAIGIEDADAERAGSSDEDRLDGGRQLHRRRALLTPIVPHSLAKKAGKQRTNTDGSASTAPNAWWYSGSGGSRRRIL